MKTISAEYFLECREWCATCPACYGSIVTEREPKPGLIVKCLMNDCGAEFEIENPVNSASDTLSDRTVKSGQ